MISRMSVIRLSGNRLFLHSPVRLSRALQTELDALGTCEWVVAPNRFHHMFVGDYASAYPDARLIAVPGLPEKRRDLSFDRVLGEAPDPEWGDDVQHVLIKGSAVMSEAAFFHAASGTLLLADFALNVDAASPLGLRLWAMLNGNYRRVAASRVVRMTYRERDATRKSVERILEWDFHRIIVCHGDVITENARAVFMNAVRWLR